MIEQGDLAVLGPKVCLDRRRWVLSNGADGGKFAHGPFKKRDHTQMETYPYRRRANSLYC